MPPRRDFHGKTLWPLVESSVLILAASTHPEVQAVDVGSCSIKNRELLAAHSEQPFLSGDFTKVRPPEEEADN